MGILFSVIVLGCTVFTVWMVLYALFCAVRGLFRFVFGWENERQKLERQRREHELWPARFSGRLDDCPAEVRHGRQISRM